MFSQAAVRTARECGARAIVTWSRGGIAARLLSRQRPGVPIVAPTRSEDTWRRLALPYGVRPVLCPRGRMALDQLEREIGPLEADGLPALVGHIAGDQRRVPWMKLVRVADTERVGASTRASERFREPPSHSVDGPEAQEDAPVQVDWSCRWPAAPSLRSS